MPKVYRKPCDQCGIMYEGLGRRFCSTLCADDAKREGERLPQAPEEHIDVAGGKDTLRAVVYGSATIKSPDELEKAAGIDTETWERYDDTVKTWPVAMKGQDKKPMVVPLHYVACRYRLRASAAFDFTPNILKIVRPRKRQPNTAEATTVHYSDIHFPHHDPRCLSILYQILDVVNPIGTIDHGDTMDCEQISKYEKNPHERTSMKTEVDMAATHHGIVHSLTPNAWHKWLLGNHEDRIRREVWKLADQRAAGELLTLPDVQDSLRLERLTGVEDLGWETLPYPQFQLLFDRLILKHGDVVRKESGQSARAEYAKYAKSGISGHTHRRGSYEHRDHNGVHAWFELGLLGRIRNDYVSFPDWQQGFGVVTWSEDRTRYGFEHIRIHEGVAHFRGKVFVGDEGDTSDLAA